MQDRQDTTFNLQKRVLIVFKKQEITCVVNGM